jgi:putative ABC transport system ATP-binding protein
LSARLEGISYVVPAGDGMQAVLEGISVGFEAGCLNLVCGPSGSGKSTMLAMLGGLLTPSQGGVRVLGRELCQMSSSERTRFRLHHVGFVFQHFELFRSLTALENVSVALEIRGAPRAVARAKALTALERMGLALRARRLPGQLSGGEKQRVALARALVAHPDVLLADEPTASLDAAAALEVAQLLRCEADRGRLVLVASHDHRLMDRADRITRLQDGRMVHG